MSRVLVVDDDPQLLRALRITLRAAGHEVVIAADGRTALHEAAAAHPDVVVLDLGLPDLDGTEVLAGLRPWFSGPVLVLSARGDSHDKVAALDAGADDYVTKPFGIGELLARMRVALRRVVVDGDPVFTIGALTVDLGRRLVSVNGQEVQLTPTEYDLLRILVTHAGKVLTHRHLLREVWGAGYTEGVHTLRVNVSNLRRKIEPDPSRPTYIITEPGVGYRLRAEFY